MNYRFVYNACCDVFYVFMDTRGYIVGNVKFALTQNPEKKTYLGELGETGILVKSSSNDTLKPLCRSPMSPNIYPIKFSEIKICKDTTGCREGTCLFVKDGAELNYDFGFKTISCKADFLYMPLSRDPLLVIYDPKTGSIVLK